MSNPIDSLTNLINNEESDLVRINLMLQKGQMLTHENRKEAQELFKQAIKNAEKNNYFKQQAQANIALGKLYVKINKLDSANIVFERGVAISKKNNLIKEKVVCLVEIGTIFCLKSDYLNSIKQFYAALDEFSVYQNDTIRANLFNNLAQNYYKLEDYSKALDFFFQSLNLKKQIGDSISISRTFNNLGNVYADLKEYDKSLFYYNKRLEIAKKNNNHFSMAISYANIAGVYREKKEYRQALQYAYKALEIDSALNDLYGIAADYNEIAFSYKGLKQYTMAELYLNKSLVIVREIKDCDLEINLLKDFYETYEEMGENGKALHFYKQYTVLKDSLFNETKNKQIVEADKKYETQKKNAEIKQLKIEQIEDENMKKLFLVIIAFLFIVAIILVVFFRQRIKVNSILKDKNIQLKQLNNTQNQLMGIISHDFKAPLSAFYSITNSLKNKHDKIDKKEVDNFLNRMLNSSIALKLQLENMLNWAINQQREIVVEKRVFNLSVLVYKVTMILQEFANEKSISIENDIDEGYELKTDGKLLSIVLNNLVANAIKFSLPNSIVKIISNQDNGQITMSVKDNGVGMSEDALSNLFLNNGSSVRNENSGTGLGLVVSKNIVDKLGGRIWAESEINKGTEIFVELPAKG